LDTIYHLALQSDWQECVDKNTIYYPPTYEQDGFTHGTGDANKLLDVANHFYQSSEGDWVCLAMTESALGRTGVIVKLEPAANVGDQDGRLDGEQELFPHLFGGISPDTVHGVYSVTRNKEGQFLDIDLPDVNEKRSDGL
jgi:uncharacterized protein (DUF952 family)